MRLTLYLLRWQLSTPVVAAVVWLFSPLGVLASVAVANLVGGLVFFQVDRWIFSRREALFQEALRRCEWTLAFNTEWSGPRVDSCPICNQGKERGHGPDCIVGLVLKKRVLGRG
jgi:hypothetical protein